VPAFRECILFSINAIGIYAAPTLMSLIDAAFIGRQSTMELAALGPAGSISDSAPTFLLFLSIAATNLVAKSHAAGNEVGSARISRTCLGLGVSAGVVMATIVSLGASAMSRAYCGANAVNLAPLCSSYVLIRALALPAVVVASVAQAICIGIKDTRTPMLGVAAAGCLNLAGDFLLVSKLKLGLAGAAWATAASQLCAACLLVRVLWARGLLRGEGVASGSQLAAPSAGSIGSAPSTTWETIVAVGSFASFIFVMTVKVSMHNACAAVAAALGGAAAAAHTALMAIAWLCFTVGDVGSSLAQAYLPAFTTAGEPRRLSPPRFDLAAARPTIAMLLRVTAAISMTVITLSSTLIGGLCGQLTPDVAVQREMRRVLPMMIATLSFHGTAVMLEGLLLARKAFRGLTLTYIGVAASVAVALALVVPSGYGLLGVWAVYVWYCAGRVLAFAAFGGLLRSDSGGQV